MNKIKILFVEDNLNLGFLTREFLENEGFDVKIYRDGEAGLKAFRENDFHLCLLDVMMPKMDGYELAEHIRKQKPDMPIIFLTAKAQKDDKGKGFSLGADDYITKPFDEDELLWRINAVLKRVEKPISESVDVQDSYKMGSIVFEPANQMLRSKEAEQRLTERETMVLQELCAQKGSLVRRDYLLNKIWGEADYFTGRSLDVFITKLRRYLKSDSNITIDNVPRVGYVLSCKD